jgi:hypothetical protein
MKSEKENITVDNMELHDGDIVTLPEHPRTRFRLEAVKNGYASFKPVKKDGTRDRRWDVGFTRTLAGVTRLSEKEKASK